MNRVPASVFVIALLAFSACAPRPQGYENYYVTPYRVTVQAGGYDRIATPASFDWPDELERGPFVLVARVETLPVQLDYDDRGWFIIHDLPAEKERTYRLVRVDDAGDDGVDANRYGNTVSFRVDDRPFLQYQGAGTMLPRPDIDPIYRRGGYVHPVFTPSGRLITDHYPANHLHQNGIWAAWTETRLQGRRPDFWNLAEGTGAVRPVALDRIWEGPVHGGLTARHQYVELLDSGEAPVLDEVWTMQVFDTHEGPNPYWMMDLELSQTAATDSVLHLLEYLYGGIALRGNWDWNGEDDTFFLTSEGLDRVSGNSSRARWVHMGGYVDGRLAGVATLSHPDNFRAPQPLRLHPSEPYFSFAPPQLGDFSITPGEPYTARYRFIVSDGPPEPSQIDRLWNDYAHPPTVTVTMDE